MAKRASWNEVKGQRPLSDEGRSAHEDEARITAFRSLVYRLRTEAGLTQAELAQRMGTTQSAIARMEGGGTRPTLETLEKRSPWPSAASSWSASGRISRTIVASPSCYEMGTQ